MQYFHQGYYNDGCSIFYLLTKTIMSKDSLRKHPSIKGTLPGLLERRDSRENFEEHPSDAKLPCLTEQSQVMKKIQNKLRMRKRSSNMTGNERTLITPPDQPDMSSETNLNNTKNGQSTIRHDQYDSTDIAGVVQELMDHDQNIGEKITLSGMNVNKQYLKQQLLKQTTFIVCQLNKGKRIEQVIYERVNALIENSKIKQRIEEKQKSIMAMMDDRIKKLMHMQKPLVH